MNRSGLRSRLAALLTALFVSAGLLSLSSAPAWAAAGTVTEFPAGGSFGITAGPDGNLWFTDEGNKIGRITTAGIVTEFPIPTASSRPSGITAGPDGNVGVTESRTRT